MVLKNKERNQMMNKCLIGIFLICFLLMVVVRVEGVRGEGLMIAENPVPGDDSQISIKDVESKLGVHIDKSMIGGLYDPSANSLTSPDGSQTIKLDSAPSTTEIKMENGEMKISPNGNTKSSFVLKGQGTATVDGNGFVSSSDLKLQTVAPDGGVTGVNAPGGGQCGSGGGGEGGEGGKEGGSKTPKADAAISQLSSITQGAGALASAKDTLKKQPNPTELWLPKGGEVSVDKGAVAGVTDGSKAVVLAQNDPNTPAFLKGTMRDYETGNSVVANYDAENKLASIITTPTNNPTQVTNDIAAGNPALNPGTTVAASSARSTQTAEFLPLVRAEDNIDSLITGDAIISVGQYISMIVYNIDVGGENLGVYLLKPFDKIKVRGSNVVIGDGETEIGFKGPKTYYPREIKKTEHFINEIKNGVDSNIFKIMPGGTKGNYLVDSNKTVTVGEETVSNPLKGFENVKIPREREAMWKKARDAW